MSSQLFIHSRYVTNDINSYLFARNLKCHAMNDNKHIWKRENERSTIEMLRFLAEYFQKEPFI